MFFYSHIPPHVRPKKDAREMTVYLFRIITLTLFAQQLIKVTSIAIKVTPSAIKVTPHLMGVIPVKVTSGCQQKFFNFFEIFTICYYH